MGVGLGWRRMHSSNPYISGQAWSDKVTRSGNTVSYSLNLCMKVERASGYWDYVWYVDMQVGSNTSNNRKVKNNTSWHKIIGGKEYYQSTFNGNFIGSINVSGKATSIQLRAQFHDSNGNRGPNVYWNVPIPVATSMDDIKKEVSGVGSDIASISAKVTKTGNYSTITSWKLEYGVRNYSENVKTISGNNLSVNWLLENLLADTNYKYRITVSNSSGYSKQATGVFRTEEEVIGYRVTKGELIEPGVYEDGEASGEFVQIDNTYENEGQITSVEMLGNTEQTTYSGKNLLPPTADWTQTVSGVTITCSNGQYTFSGTSTANGSTTARATIAPYTIQSGDYFHYGNTLVSQSVNIQVVFTDATYFANSMNAANRIFSLESYVGKTIASCRVNFVSGNTFNGVAKPMILHNVSTTSDYEPYVGGIPAPNPQFPQPISTVTGEQTIQVTGKNLLEITQSSVINQGTYVSGANTNEYKIKATGNDLFVNAASTAGTSYTSTRGNLISCNYGETIYFNVGNNNFQKNYFTEWDENLVSLGYTLVSSSSGTYTPTKQGCKYVNFRFGNGYSVPNTTYTLSPIVCKTSNIAYEPYHGQSYEIKLLQENLLPDIPDGTVTAAGITTTWSNGTAHITGTNTSTSFNISNTLYFTTPLQAGETYTFSMATTSPHKVVLRMYDTSTQTWSAPYEIAIGQTSTTARLPFPCDRAAIYMGSVPTTGSKDITLSGFRFGRAIELAKVGTYQDYIWNDGGTWKIHKSTAVAVLNGTENWVESGTTHERFVIGSAQTTFSLLAKGTPSYKSKCDHFTFQEGGTAWTGIGRCGFDGLGTFWCMISGMSSLADFKAWLGANNVRVYYPLATPTDTEITDSELVGQLERLGVATLYVGLNNVLVATNNVAPTLKIDYKLTVKEPVYDDRSDELVGWIIYPDGRKKKIKEIRRVYPT